MSFPIEQLDLSYSLSSHEMLKHLINSILRYHDIVVKPKPHSNNDFKYLCYNDTDDRFHICCIFSTKLEFFRKSLKTKAFEIIFQVEGIEINNLMDNVKIDRFDIVDENGNITGKRNVNFTLDDLELDKNLKVKYIENLLRRTLI